MIEADLGVCPTPSWRQSPKLVGLTAEAKSLSPKRFYDDLGCELFEAITAAAE